MNEPATDQLSQRALATALGLSPAMVTKLKKAGMPVDSVAAAQWWRSAHQRLRASTGTVPPAVAGSATAGNARAPATPAAPPSDNGYSAARARRELAEAERAEDELRKARGQLVAWEDVQRGGFEVARALRDALEAAVNPLAAEMAALRDASKCAEVLRQHNRAVCDVLVKGWRERIGPLPSGGLA